MIAATTLVFDTTGLKPIQPSGFVPPSQRTDYSDLLVQDLLREAFGGQFPKLEAIEKNAAIYRHENPASGSLIDCAAVQSIDDIPQTEIMRLLQGWITLRRIVMETAAPEGVRSLLMNLRIPDPRVAPHFYRISNQEGEERKLYVLIGFEGPTAPSMALEEGIASMLNVKPSQLESLLATSMGPSKSTPRPMSHDAPAVNAPVPAAKPSSAAKNVALLCSSVALLVFAVGIVWKMNAQPSRIPASEPVATASPSAVPPVSHPALSIAEPADAPAALAPLPTLEAMTTEFQPGTATPPVTSPSPQTSKAADLTDLMTQ